MHHFPHDVVVDPATGMPSPGAIGKFVDQNGTPIRMYDATGAPISQIVADVHGMYPDIPVDDTVWGGWSSFGANIQKQAWVIEAPLAIQQALDAVGIASTAAADASVAVQSAGAAATAASTAAAAAQANSGTPMSNLTDVDLQGI